MTTSSTNCERIIALIDVCLAEFGTPIAPTPAPVKASYSSPRAAPPMNAVYAAALMRCLHVAGYADAASGQRHPDVNRQAGRATTNGRRSDVEHHLRPDSRSTLSTSTSSFEASCWSRRPRAVARTAS